MDEIQPQQLPSDAPLRDAAVTTDVHSSAAPSDATAAEAQEAVQSHDVEPAKRGCSCICCPRVAEHPVAEVGGSRYVPWRAMMWWRLLCFAALSVTFVLLLVLGAMDIRVWFSAVLLPANAVTYCLLSGASWRYGAAREASRYSSWCAFWHTVAATGAFYFAPRYTIHVVALGRYLLVAPVYLPVACYVIDVVVLQARIKPRYWYGLPMLVVFAVITLIEYTFFFSAMDTGYYSPLFSVITLVTVIVGAIALLFISIGLTRLHLCFGCAAKERTDDVERGLDGGS